MTKLIQKMARFSAILAFFIIFLAGVLSEQTLSVARMLDALFKASVGALLFWIIAIITGDIALKGMLESLGSVKNEKWLGGLLSRFAAEKEKTKKSADEELAAMTAEKEKPVSEKNKGATKS